AVPMTATGVSGNTSDLYRRVSMLLKSPMRVEKCCPRSWTWGIAAVLIAFAIVLGGVSLTAEAQGRIIIIETGDKPQADVLKHVEGGVKILLQKPGDRDVFLYRAEELPGKDV